jgi:DNA polymerase-3 subunit delta
MAAHATPRYFILHGEDELACGETLKDLQSRLGPPELSSLNVTRFEGSGVTLAELKNVCDTIPFLTERRMVIVQGLLTYLGASAQKKQAQDRRRKHYMEQLGAYLSQLPETTRLVFVEPVELSRQHPLLQQAQEDPLGYVRLFRPPRDLVQWVHQRARDKGGEFTVHAAHNLVQAVGEDQRLLDQEIIKLLTYTDGARPVTVQDVSLLVPYAQEAVIFDAVDALGQRNGTRAVQLIHNLLDHGNDPRYLFAMVVRQFRLLIQIKELDQQGLDTASISRRIKLHPYPTRKLHGQARNFTLDQLERVHRRLLEIDIQTKTGQIDEIVALDLLIAGLAPPQ